MQFQKKTVGVFYACIAYIWWGFLPLFWAVFDSVGNGWEVIAHRIVWTAVLLLLWIGLVPGFGRLRAFASDVFSSARLTVLLLAAAAAAAVNFWINVAGVIDNHVVELGIGTFLTPLLTVLLGMLCFGERAPFLTWAAIALAFAGVLTMCVQYGEIPFYALTVSLSWASYGALKKALMRDPVMSLAVETLLLLPLAAGYLVSLTLTANSHFLPSQDPGLAAAFLLTGLMAAIPLVAFTIGAMRLSLSVLGFIQYLAPLIIVALGVFVFDEPFGLREFIPLALIWAGIALFLFSRLRARTA